MMPMRHTLAIAALGLSATLATAPLPAAAQSSNVQQMLQGLFNGDQGHDRGVQEAFERGYQRGREDEARQRQAGARYDRRDDVRDAYRDNGGRVGPSDRAYPPPPSGYGR